VIVRVAEHYHQPPQDVARWPVKWVFRALLWRDIQQRPTASDLKRNGGSGTPAELIVPPGIGR
jgi:hypothetical protein